MHQKKLCREQAKKLGKNVVLRNVKKLNQRPKEETAIPTAVGINQKKQTKPLVTIFSTYLYTKACLY